MALLQDPRRGAGDTGRQRGAEAAGLCALVTAGSSREMGAQQGSPVQHPWSRAHHEPRAGARSPGWGVREEGYGVPSERGVFTCTRRHPHPRQGLP